MASTQIEFLDGPRKGNPMKVGGKNDGDAFGDRVTVAYIKDDGSTGFAVYEKVRQRGPTRVFIPSNRYRYVGEKGQEGG